MKCTKDRIALCSFVLSAMLLVFGVGFVTARLGVFPYPLFAKAQQGWREVRLKMMRRGPMREWPREALPWWSRPADASRVMTPTKGHEAFQGPSLVTGLTRDFGLFAAIIDMEGRRLHAWDLDWFKLWPDAQHLPAHRRPKQKPGTHVHGAVVMDNGDLVFNFDQLGLVRIDRDGDIVWRLPYQTHHSLHLRDDGHLWVCGQREYSETSSHFPSRTTPFIEFTVLEVLPDGQIANEWFLSDILRKNGLEGLLFLRTQPGDTMSLLSDTLHLNDVEPFPTQMAEGFFKQGDILVSLRNINTVLAFNAQSEKVSFTCTGWFIWQHDADFIDGDSFSVFDNNYIGLSDIGHSRIVRVSAPSRTREFLFEGSSDVPFYTRIMGKHQWLPNGNLLISEAMRGRAFELNKNGEVVWEYFNNIDDGVVGLMQEVQRLPSEYATLFNRAL